MMADCPIRMGAVSLPSTQGDEKSEVHWCNQGFFMLKDPIDYLTGTPVRSYKVT